MRRASRRGVALLGMEVHGNRVAEDLAHQPIAEVLEVPRPDLLELITLDQLGEGGFRSTWAPATATASFSMLFDGACRVSSYARYLAS